MRTSELDLLFVAGLGGSGPEHWQTRWRTRLPTAQLVEQADWNAPDFQSWTEAIVAACERAERPVFLVAHSLGVTCLAHAAARLSQPRVRGAFLVAPPSDEALKSLELETFVPTPTGPLPFPSMLVASRNDPYSSFAQAEDRAADWGSRLVDSGDAGHINVESGHGPWPEGLLQFAAFIRGL